MPVSASVNLHWSSDIYSTCFYVCVYMLPLISVGPAVCSIWHWQPFLHPKSPLEERHVDLSMGPYLIKICLSTDTQHEPWAPVNQALILHKLSYEGEGTSLWSHKSLLHVCSKEKKQNMLLKYNVFFRLPSTVTDWFSLHKSVTNIIWDSF